MTRHKAILSLSFSLLVLLSSCSQPPPSPPPATTLSQAQQHFLKICTDELKYEAYIFPAGKTMWVYVPLNDGIIVFKPADKTKTPKAPTNESWSIVYLEAGFDHAAKTLTVSYDIERTRKYDNPTTYQNKYSDEYSTKQREVLTALTRAYFDVGQKQVNVPLTVGDDQVELSDPVLIDTMKNNALVSSADEAPPDFFVMVFADIKNGIAVKATNYFKDMKMALSNPPAITNDEYVKRYVYELFGEEEMIGDETGARLKTEEIQLADFLAKQIENRIKYQFTQSGFPPEGEVRDELWTIIAETYRLYEFKDFEKIRLIDLKSKKEAIYDRNQL